MSIQAKALLRLLPSQAPEGSPAWDRAVGLVDELLAGVWSDGWNRAARELLGNAATAPNPYLPKPAAEPEPGNTGWSRCESCGQMRRTT